MDSLGALEPAVLFAVTQVASRSPRDLVAARRAQIDKYRQIARDLSEQELALKESMPEDIRHVMQNKSILLMKRMMLDAGVTDDLLPFHLSTGFPLTGELPVSGQFAPMWRPAAVDRK